MKQNKILSIAVTGGIGSGKSLACKILNELGYPNISADMLGHQVLKQPEIIEMLAIEFGREIVKDGIIDRLALGNRAFNTPNGSQKLNNLMHPPIVELLKKKILEQKVTTIYEIPLLFEASLQDLFDITLLVTAKEDIRLKRILERPGMTKEKAEKILKTQMPESKKMVLADFVIINDGTETELKKKLTDFLSNHIGKSRS